MRVSVQLGLSGCTEDAGTRDIVYDYVTHHSDEVTLLTPRESREQKGKKGQYRAEMLSQIIDYLIEAEMP